MGYKLLDTLSTLCMFNRERGNFDGVIKVLGQEGATTSATQLRTLHELRIERERPTGMENIIFQRIRDSNLAKHGGYAVVCSLSRGFICTPYWDCHNTEYLYVSTHPHHLLLSQTCLLSTDPSLCSRLENNYSI